MQAMSEYVQYKDMAFSSGERQLAKSRALSRGSSSRHLMQDSLSRHLVHDNFIPVFSGSTLLAKELIVCNGR